MTWRKQTKVRTHKQAHSHALPIHASFFLHWLRRSYYFHPQTQTARRNQEHLPPGIAFFCVSCVGACINKEKLSTLWGDGVSGVRIRFKHGMDVVSSKQILSVPFVRVLMYVCRCNTIHLHKAMKFNSTKIRHIVQVCSEFQSQRLYFAKTNAKVLWRVLCRAACWQVLYRAAYCQVLYCAAYCQILCRAA